MTNVLDRIGLSCIGVGAMQSDLGQWFRGAYQEAAKVVTKNAKEIAEAAKVVGQNAKEMASEGISAQLGNCK